MMLPRPVAYRQPRAAHVVHTLHSASRTTQYKKITKPLLERKRRARINRCLDELKDLMVGDLEAEGENVNKLEKADILELTVRHLHRITRTRDPAHDAHRFQEGFSQCASEACGFLLSLPGLDARVGRRLVAHLGQCISTPLSVQVPSRQQRFSPPVSPVTPPRQNNRTPTPATATASQFYSPFTTTPSVQDLSRPINGLLMTVPTKTRRSSSATDVSTEDVAEEASEDSTEVWRPWNK